MVALTPIRLILAILGAAIYAAPRGSERIRLGWGVLAAFVAVVVLDGLRDSQAADIQATACWLGLTLISVLGILLLGRLVGTPRVVEAASPVG